MRRDVRAARHTKKRKEKRTLSNVVACRHLDVSLFCTLLLSSLFSRRRSLWTFDRVASFVSSVGAQSRANRRDKALSPMSSPTTRSNNAAARHEKPREREKIPSRRNIRSPPVRVVLIGRFHERNARLRPATCVGTTFVCKKCDLRK